MYNFWIANKWDSLYKKKRKIKSRKGRLLMAQWSIFGSMKATGIDLKA